MAAAAPVQPVAEAMALPGQELPDLPRSRAAVPPAPTVRDAAPLASQDLPAPEEPDAAEVGPPAPPRGYTVLIIGDSLAQGLGAGLGQVLRRYGNVSLIPQGRLSSGLVHVGYFDWDKALRKLQARHRADAIVVALGANDAGQSMWVERGRMTGFASEQWLAIYRQRVAALIRVAQDASAEVFWVGLPVMADRAFAEKARLLNDIYRQQAEAEGATFIPTWELTASETGEFSSFVRLEGGARARIRSADGIHFNMRGYAYLAEHIVDALRQRLPLRPR